MPIPSCVLTEKEVTNGFLRAPPLISEQIANLTITHPSWTRDLAEYVEFPLGSGTEMQSLIFRGSMPQIERGFDSWKQLSNAQGCNDCDGPDCSYNITQFPGTGLERKAMRLMSREFRSPSYCVKEIQTTANFEEVFAQVVQNLYAQVDFFKDMNISFNYLTGLAKKFVVDSGGAKPNTSNPYVYPNIGSVTLSTLNVTMLQFFYEWLRRIPDVIPYGSSNGAPIYALECSGELLANLYREDPQLRQDVRFSGLANDLLMKYNFMSSIRNMFLPAPILNPRRFNIVAGEPVEVLPYINGIPMEVGSFTGFNPAYQSATHEEVLIHGKSPFKIAYMNTTETLGANTSFGPEYSFMNNWAWVNPQTVEDPLRRVGFFMTEATIGLMPQWSEGIFGILVTRPVTTMMASFLPQPVCPPTPVECDNEIDATGCPCPLILSFIANPITAGNYFLTLAVALDAAPDDEVQFGVETGGYITGTIVAITADGKTVEVTFTEDLTDCDPFTTIFCDNTLGCVADVYSYQPLVSDNTRVSVVLNNPIKADTAADKVTVYYGNGASGVWTVVSADMLTNTWVLDSDDGVFGDNVGGLVSVCVPTSTDSTCPDCGGPVLEDCTT